MLPLIILAGGLGTRLKPFSDTFPKSLVPVLNQPFVLHQLALLKKNNISEIIFCIGHHGQQIETLLGKGESFNLSISYHYDGDTLLGTAGSLRRIYTHLPDTFFLLYGDAYLPCDYTTIGNQFLNSHHLAQMTVFHNTNLGDKSNVLFDKNTILSYNKSTPHPLAEHIDYGLGLFRKEAFSDLPYNQPYDLATLYQTLLEKNQLGAFEVFERFYEVGSWNGIRDLEHYLTMTTSPCTT